MSRKEDLAAHTANINTSKCYLCCRSDLSPMSSVTHQIAERHRIPVVRFEGQERKEDVARKSSPASRVKKAS
jgi:hypothetical protein